MSSMKFYAQGIEDATITVSIDGGATVSTSYPKDNLKLRSRRFKMQTTGGATNMTEIDIEFDFGASTVVDYLYIDKSNLSTIAVTQSIIFNYWNGSSWIDTGYDGASSITDSPSIDTFTQRTATKYQLVIIFSVEPSVEFWMNFCLMGQMITDERFFPDFGATNINKNLGLVVHEAINGNKSAVRITQVESKKVRGKFDRTFKILTDAQFNELNRIYTDTNEMLYPFALSDYDDTLRFVRVNTESYLEQMRYNIRNSTTLTFMEEI